ncbi:hypothetical protein SAMD00023353_5500490 [Rosellinia necatrix]|uniref:Uncharacterized protein n=1 Tax=Rosellinia necatrix TaxID=77044 RepID=A0A1S8AA11_ROSNE|nr:hypothetical protein SAMD00023353_5500490 [Rosellinia necatrix]
MGPSPYQRYRTREPGLSGAAYINKNFFGGKLSRDQLEKATDSGRAALEKATGKKVPSQLSN